MKTATLVSEPIAKGWLYTIHPGVEKLNPAVWFKTYDGEDREDNDIYKGAIAWIHNQNVEVISISKKSIMNLDKHRKYALETKYAFLAFEKTQKGWLCLLKANRLGSGLAIWLKEHIGDDPIDSSTAKEAYEWAKSKNIEITGQGGTSYRNYVRSKKNRLKKKEQV